MEWNLIARDDRRDFTMGKTYNVFHKDEGASSTYFYVPDDNGHLKEFSYGEFVEFFECRQRYDLANWLQENDEAITSLLLKEV